MFRNDEPDHVTCNIAFSCQITFLIPTRFFNLLQMCSYSICLRQSCPWPACRLGAREQTAALSKGCCQTYKKLTIWAHQTAYLAGLNSHWIAVTLGTGCELYRDLAFYFAVAISCRSLRARILVMGAKYDLRPWAKHCGHLQAFCLSLAKYSNFGMENYSCLGLACHTKVDLYWGRGFAGFSSCLVVGTLSRSSLGINSCESVWCTHG